MNIVVIGLGYVGLPLAVQLAKYFETTGVDIDSGRIAELRRGHDRTAEISADILAASALVLTDSAADVAAADMYIVTVPTPIDGDNRPDLGPVLSATRSLAFMLDRGRTPIIVYESTVYPGVTEDICGPLIEELSGLRRGTDFFLGYSPERINPGDREHTVDRIQKVIAGENPAVTETLADVYGRVTSGGVFRAASIRVAEAAKVIENSQRDINIAFMNELSRIFDRMDVSIWDVLAAARTKWNFLPFEPGLVGGHCIGVDPYYLSHRAQELGYDANVILSGRAVNDGMAPWVADRVHEAVGGKPGRILVLGLTFKENVPDLRNSKVVDMIARLRHLGHQISIDDPVAAAQEALDEYGLVIDRDAPGRQHDVVIGAVPHAGYRTLTPTDLARALVPGGLIADLKAMWNRSDIETAGFRYWTL